ncbi:MAG: nucleotidyltransferase family protein [Caulobacteraceae bacterium]
MSSPARLEDAVKRLRDEQPEARELYGVEFVGVVGSVARGEETDASDIDVLVNIVGYTTYFRIGELEAKLEARLGRPVDLVDRKTLRPSFQSSLERDLVRV